MSRDGDSTTSLGNLFLCMTRGKLEFAVFQFVPTVFSSFIGLHEVRLALPSFLSPSTKGLYIVVLLFF